VTVVGSLILSVGNYTHDAYWRQLKWLPAAGVIREQQFVDCKINTQHHRLKNTSD
jgi:hypothetical protein